MSTAAGTRDGDLLRRQRGAELPLRTPEGVPLHFTVALAGDRIGAFIVDWLLSKLLVLGLALLMAFVDTSGHDAGWIFSLLVIAAFAVEQFYFIWFEVRGRGMTPGKRRVGIRVVSRRAGPITAEAIVARNLTRVLEIDVALAMLLVPDAIWPQAPGWTHLVAMIWVLVFAGMPLFNRHRLRVGDMVAGTTVVVSPRALLLHDLGGTTQRRAQEEGRRFPFTPEQLSVYGVYELQVLEELLRQPPNTAARNAMIAVARKICRKIGYDRKVHRRDVSRFLREFYAAMRAHQEHRLLFGRRKRDKHSREERL